MAALGHTDGNQEVGPGQKVETERDLKDQDQEIEVTGTG